MMINLPIASAKQTLIYRSVMLACLVCVPSPVLAAMTSPPKLTIHNPASMSGVHIGDVLTRRLQVEVSNTYQLAHAQLPKKNIKHDGMTLVGLDVQSAHHAERTTYTIRMDYQVFAVSQIPAVMRLPQETFTFNASAAGQPALALNVPTWSFWFSPLVTGSTATAKKNLLPDVPPPLINAEVHQWRLGAGLATALLSLLSLIYINADGPWLPLMGGAFAQAHRKIKRLAKTGKTLSGGDVKQAYVYLHQAFNQHFGANIFARDIDEFLRVRPHFQSAKSEIATFFDASSKALFCPLSGNSREAIASLLQLSQQLRDCERGVA